MTICGQTTIKSAKSHQITAFGDNMHLQANLKRKNKLSTKLHSSMSHTNVDKLVLLSGMNFL